MPPRSAHSQRKASDPKPKSKPNSKPNTRSISTFPTSSSLPPSTSSSTPTTTTQNPHPAAHLLSLTPLPPTTTSTIFTTRILQKPLLLRPSSPPPPPPTSTTKAPLSKPSDTRTHRRQHRLSRPRKSHHLSRHTPTGHHPPPLSAREKRQLGTYDLPYSRSRKRNSKKDKDKDKAIDQSKDINYATYFGLHALWVGYMQEVLGMHSAAHPLRPMPIHTPTSTSTSTPPAGRERSSSNLVDSIGHLISSADLHGAEVEVVRSRDFGRVGARGIVVRESKGVVVIVCPRNGKGAGEEGAKGMGVEDGEGRGKGKGGEVRRVPKRGTVFRVRVPWPRLRAGGGGTAAEGEAEGEAEGKEKKTDEEIQGEDQTEEEQPPPPPPLTFDIHGSGFEVRPADRARKGFKWKAMDYL